LHSRMCMPILVSFLDPNAILDTIRSFSRGEVRTKGARRGWTAKWMIAEC